MSMLLCQDCNDYKWSATKDAVGQFTPESDVIYIYISTQASSSVSSTLLNCYGQDDRMQ